MKFEQHSVLPAPSPKLIGELETEIGDSLPEDYVQFIHQSNGGIPIPNTFKAQDNVKVIERFLALVEDVEESGRGGLVRHSGSIIPSRRKVCGWILIPTPSPIIPIAALFAGDFLCLDYRGVPDPPSIVIWDHERSDDYSPVTYAIARSFTAFISMINSDQG